MSKPKSERLRRCWFCDARPGKFGWPCPGRHGQPCISGGEWKKSRGEHAVKGRLRPRKAGDWRATAGLVLSLRMGSRSLHVSMTATSAGGDEWTVLAIESDAKAVRTQEILDNHAHHVVGVFDLGRAIREAEKYARAWRPSKDACGCQEIAVPAPAPKRRR